MKTLPKIIILFCVASCTSNSDQISSEFPDKWIGVDEKDSEWVIEESAFGLDKIELVKTADKVSEIRITEGGGAEVYLVKETKNTDEGYLFILDSGKEIAFNWINQKKKVGEWSLDYGSRFYVPETNMDNLQYIPFVEEGNEKDVQEVSQGSDEYIYVGAEINGDITLVNFINKNTEEILGFNFDQFESDYSQNEFFRSMNPKDGGIYPTLLANRESLYQPYYLEYHTDQVENSIAGIMEETNILDEVRRFDIRSESEQQTRIYLTRIPIKAFGSLTDEVSETTIRNLLIYGKSGSWILDKETRHRIIFYHEITQSSVTMARYTYNNNDNDLIAVYTQNENITNLEFWRSTEKYPAKLDQLSSDELSIEIDSKDFFDHIPDMDLTHGYILNEDNTILIFPEFKDDVNEEVTENHWVMLSWKGSSFEKTIVDPK